MNYRQKLAKIRCIDPSATVDRRVTLDGEYDFDTKLCIVEDKEDGLYPILGYGMTRIQAINDAWQSLLNAEEDGDIITVDGAEIHGHRRCFLLKNGDWHLVDDPRDLS
jgi:hypothetical protein